MTGDLQQPYTLKHPKCQNLKAPPEQTQPFANNNDSSDAEVLLGAPGPCHPGRHSSDHAILTAPPRMMNIGFCSGIRPAIRHNQPARCTPTNALHPDERNAPRRTPCTPTSATHPDERNAPRRARRTPTNATPHGPTPTSPKRKRRVPRSASDVPDHTSHARTAHRAVPHERPAPRRARRHTSPPRRARRHTGTWLAGRLARSLAASLFTLPGGPGRSSRRRRGRRRRWRAASGFARGP